ncbi:IS66 family insertion sequence element accessory protein TnpB [Dyadobacter sp. LJ53]|uniref:IS66 family insertion sequence element accessory protein TnpA n=1 Tax=Dyadobacter chenwenxiniae TaxID=2906456 RepID=UPI001F381D03|nr:IS66 family insertion sequence element accessory protein TnpB [Dyadobacter chenwenxiniae]MCF0049336.1 IS66 family insertion sequence element accessory protein TnpB [Dyadobacter chenwenxiniae]
MDQSEEMFKLVREWRESGLSKSEFCKPHGITIAKFGYWAGKEKLAARLTAEKAGGFVQVSGQQSASSDSYQVAYPNGVKVNYQGNDLATLSQLIKLY